VDVPPSFKYQITGLEPSDVRGLLGRVDYFHRGGLPDLRHFSENLGRFYRDRHKVDIAGITQLLCSCGSYSRQLF